MTRWEYQFFHIDKRKEETVDGLNVIGAAGWEAVSVRSDVWDVYVYAKRPKADEATPRQETT